MNYKKKYGGMNYQPRNKHGEPVSPATPIEKSHPPSAPPSPVPPIEGSRAPSPLPEHSMNMDIVTPIERSGVPSAPPPSPVPPIEGSRAPSMDIVTPPGKSPKDMQLDT